MTGADEPLGLKLVLIAHRLAGRLQSMGRCRV